MARSILKIHTQNGDIPIGYPGLADKPIADKTLSEEGAFADSKAVGDKFKEVKTETDSLKGDLATLDDEVDEITIITRGINLFDKDTITPNKNVNINGCIEDSSLYNVSAPIEVEVGETYTQLKCIDGIKYSLNQYIGFLDANECPIGATTSEPWYKCVIPDGCKYVIIATDEPDTTMFVKGDLKPDGLSPYDYIPYHKPIVKVDGTKVDFEGTKVEKIDTIERNIESNKEKIDTIERNINSKLPAYWKEYLDDKIDEINKMISEGFYFPVLFVTDTHIEDSAGVDGAIAKYLDDKIHFSTIVHGGDFQTTALSLQEIYKKIRSSLDTYSPVFNKMLACVGNHDSVSAGVVVPKHVYDTCLNAHLVEVNGITKPLYDNNTTPTYDILGKFGYYYRDDDINRMRYIILNSCDHFRGDDEHDIGFAFKDDQIRWLVSDALNFSSKGYGWKCTIFTHLFSRQDGIIGSEDESTTYNIDKLLACLEAFKSGTVFTDTELGINADYSEKKAIFCGYFCGHYHYDSIIKVGNIPIVATLNASLSQYAPSGHTATQKEIGTITETAMDVLLFSNDKCMLKRIGAGSDREFTY